MPVVKLYLRLDCSKSSHLELHSKFSQKDQNYTSALIRKSRLGRSTVADGAVCRRMLTSVAARRSGADQGARRDRA